LALDALAALSLGLLASAAVSTTAQAALALPMLCFPAVLFAGAVVPVNAMAPIGRFLAAIVPDRWAFEAIAADLGLRESSSSAWLVLAGFIAVLLVTARIVVGRRAAPARR
jgi:ABC transport system ATP-binding/permease protein